jgi:hypothetical protein
VPKSKEKYTPTLNRHLLEGAFAESMSQVLMSLDQVRIHKDTDLTPQQHIRALWGITMDETGVPVLLTEGRHEKTLVKKHAQFIRRIKTLRATLMALDPNEKENMTSILKTVTHWMQDAHLILHEDTPKDIREYLSEKGIENIPESPKPVEGVQ